jgi:hypothetical protein
VTAAGLVSRLDGVRCVGDGRYEARCPAHDDTVASLSVSQGDAKVLICCHAGCTANAIMGAIGLSVPDLFDEPANSEVGRRIVYGIKDAAGVVVAEHVRRGFSDGSKTFAWRRHGRSGLGGMPTSALPLYGTECLSQLDGRPVVVVEGEKARDVLASRGMNSVGTVTGAAGTPDLDALRVLVGYDVVLWPDADAAGHKHMARIAARLVALGCTPRWFEWKDAPPRGDAADFRGDTEELVQLLRVAPLWAPPDGRPADQPVGVLLSEVEPEQVEWLWEGRFPLAKISVLEGQPDEGKTALALDIAARVSTGAPMPLDSVAREPAGVVILTAEDGLGDTIRPRLEAAGADLTRIVAARLDELPSLDEAGLQLIEQLVERVSAKFVVLDPLAAFVPDRRDTYRDHDMRRTLTPVAALAARTGAAIVMIRHHKKGDKKDAKEAGGMSVAIGAAARSVYVAATDPEDSERRVLARVKCNLAAPVPSLGYRLVPAGASVRVEWLGVSTYTADELVNARTDPEAESVLGDAVDWLSDYLAAGPKAATAVRAEAKKMGVADRTLDRAKARLKIHSTKSSAGWIWKLRQSRTPTPEHGEQGDLGDLGEVAGVL